MTSDRLEREVPPRSPVGRRISRLAAGLAALLVVCEMLIVISPFAFYYYGIYGRRSGICRGESENGSAEREIKRFHAWIKKLDLELSIRDGLRLSDQLIRPLLGSRAVALFVSVDSVSDAWRLSVDEHANSPEAPRAAGAMTRFRSRA